MNKVILPEGYKSVLNSYDLQRAIALTKEIFQRKFTKNLHQWDAKGKEYNKCFPKWAE